MIIYHSSYYIQLYAMLNRIACIFFGSANQKSAQNKLYPMCKFVKHAEKPRILSYKFL